MSNPRVSAILDLNILRVNYEYRPSVNNTPVDLTVRYIYLNKRTDGGYTEVEFGGLVLPGEYLSINGISGVSELVQQAEIKFVNPNYRRSIYVEIIEDRGNGPVVTRVPVLMGDNTGDYYQEKVDNPSNPAREQVDENLPAEEPKRPSDNVITTEPPLRNWSIGPADLKYQGVPKYTVGENGIEPVVGIVLIENGISNMMPNATFNSLADKPSGYAVDGPGLLLSSSVQPISNANYWRLRASNPNWLNAFGQVTWRLDQAIMIHPSTQVLTLSFYHKLYGERGSLVVNNISVWYDFYNDQNVLIESSSTGPVPVESNKDWVLFQNTIDSNKIPINAVKVIPRIRTNALEGPDFFIWEILAPQLEEQKAASSRTTGARIQDTVFTKTPVDLSYPMKINLETDHLEGSGLRGLIASTNLRKNGWEWYVSTDRMHFKLYDGNGSVIHNSYSSSFSRDHLSRVIYSLELTTAEIKFYIDNQCIGSSTYSLVPSSSILRVGGLEVTNSNLHSRPYVLTISRTP